MFSAFAVAEMYRRHLLTEPLSNWTLSTVKLEQAKALGEELDSETFRLEHASTA